LKQFRPPNNKFDWQALFFIVIIIFLIILTFSS
jgi:hypothetical protein